MRHKHLSAIMINLPNRFKYFPAVLFLLAVILSILTTYHVTGNYIDSDASSELVLAKQLSETGNIISRDWFYSTELRVLNTQLIYAPLFHIFSDWHLVRFSGAIILQAIYMLSYGFMLNQGGFSKSDFFLSGSLLLLPVSVAYGRIMLYHCYYIPHIALSFFLVGLFLGFVKGAALSPVKDCIRLGFLFFFSFIGGLGGIRQLMITHAPMILLILLLCLIEDLHSNDTGKASFLSAQKLLPLMIAMLALLAAYLGYKVNTDIFPKYYSFRSYDNTALSTPKTSELGNILYSFLHQFGYRKTIGVMSLLGILSLGSIPAAGFCLYIAYKNARCCKVTTDLRKPFVFLFFLSYVVVMTTIFLITESVGIYNYTLYYVLCLPWAAPLLLSIPTYFPPEIHPFNFRRIFSWISIVILFANGFANIVYFRTGRFGQPYEGLSFQEKNKAAQLTELVDYLVENDYDSGYGTFWECNLITELSDGQLPMSNISITKDTSENVYLCYYDWLTFQSQRDAPKEKAFLIIPSASQQLFEQSYNFSYCTCIYSDDFHCAYHIDDMDYFSKTMYDY